MAEEQQTCQVKMHDGQLCRRPVSDGEKCICHSEKPDKDLALFNQETVRILRGAPRLYYDFTHFVFPDGWKPSIMAAKAAVYFDHARFLGEAYFQSFQFSQGVSFEHAQFKQDANFAKARFQPTANFSHCVFHGAANFQDAELHNPDFFCASFAGAAYFSGAAFTGKAQLNGATFKDESDFHDVTFSGDTQFRGAKFLGTGPHSFNEAKFAKEAIFATCRFEPEAWFRNAEFSGNASFFKTEFRGGVDASGVTFSKRADFVSTEFAKAADFSYARIAGKCDFRACRFAGPLSFEKALFAEKARCRFDAEAQWEIEREPFAAEADFRSLELDGDARLTFRKVSLERCLFLETDVTKCEFVDVGWASRGGVLGLFSRIAVADERPARLWFHWLWDRLARWRESYSWPEFQLTSELYRRLQTNFHRNYRYSEAGAFYVGEQEMMRKDKGWFRRFLCVNAAYRNISNYGESYVLPLVWLLAVLLLFPVYLVFDGVFISGEFVKYSWTGSFADNVFFKTDYWNTVWTNFSVSTLNRGQIAQFLAEPYKRALLTAESFALAVLATFFIAALRRQFKRKTF